MSGSSSDRGAAPPNWPTRRDVGARLGISTSSVRRLEFAELTPKQDVHGVWRFDPDEVACFEASRARRAGRVQRGSRDAQLRDAARRGRVACRVFQMFGRGLPLPHIVVIMKQPPEVVRELYREWSTSLEEGEWERQRREQSP